MARSAPENDPTEDNLQVGHREYHAAGVAALLPAVFRAGAEEATQRRIDREFHAQLGIDDLSGRAEVEHRTAM